MGELQLTTRCVVKPSETFRWKIENFISCPLKPGECFVTPTFMCHKGCWKLILYPDGQNISTAGNVEIYLKNRALQPREINIIFQVSVQDRSGSMFSPCRHYFTFKNGDLWGYENVISRQMLLDEMQGDLLPGGDLTLVCKIIENATKVIQGPVTKTNECKSKDTEVLDAESQLETMSHDFEKLYQCSEQSDVILKVEDQLFKAHKAVLVARSPVFATMFKNSMEQRPNNMVDIPDIPAHLFRHVLRYMYTGKSRGFSINKAFGLYAVGEKYAMPGLQSICRKVIIDSVSLSNFCDAICYAYKYCDEKLKKDLFPFLIDHKSEIIQTQKWNIFQTDQASLAASVLKDALLKISRQGEFVRLS